MRVCLAKRDSGRILYSLKSLARSQMEPSQMCGYMWSITSVICCEEMEFQCLVTILTCSLLIETGEWRSSTILPPHERGMNADMPRVSSLACYSGLHEWWERDKAWGIATKPLSPSKVSLPRIFKSILIHCLISESSLVVEENVEYLFSTDFCNRDS